MVYNWLKFAQQILYPPSCVLCGDKGEDDLDLCISCRRQLPYNLQSCSRCALPLPPSLPLPPLPPPLPLTTDSHAHLCGQCSRLEPDFQRIQAPFLYRSPIDHLVQGLKFHHQFSYSRLLGHLLAEHLRAEHSQFQNPTQVELMIPVPLHPQQLREREFNQSAELARQLSNELKLDWSSGLLHKHRQTLPQHGLNKRQRSKNLQGCFSFDNSQGLKHIAVIDDVVTTGATANEIARTLHRQGVASVEIWALARTP